MRYWVYDRIDELLKQKGLSRRKLAELSGINPSTLGALFARRPVPLPDKYLNPIAEALGVDRTAFDDNELLSESLGAKANGVMQLNVLQSISRGGKRATEISVEERVRRLLNPSEKVAALMAQIADLDDVEDVDAIATWANIICTYRDLALDEQRPTKHDKP